MKHHSGEVYAPVKHHYKCNIFRSSQKLLQGTICSRRAPLQVWHIQIISTTKFQFQSNLNNMDLWVQVSSCNTTMLDTFLCNSCNCYWPATLSLSHQLYLLGFAPNDDHILWPLKEVMGRKSFRSEEDVQQAHEWLPTWTKDFFKIQKSMYDVGTGGLVSNITETMMQFCDIFDLKHYKKKKTFKVFICLTLIDIHVFHKKIYNSTSLPIKRPTTVQVFHQKIYNSTRKSKNCFVVIS